MVPMSRLAILLAVLPMMASAQEGPLTWFPLKVGTRWVYDHEAKSGDPGRPDTERWTTEETITGQVAIPEGMVVLREVKQEVNSAQQTHGHLSSRDREPYLVHGDCVYVIDGGWDAGTEQLRADYRQYLRDGRLSPDFCFPLRTGRTWGNNDIPWQVQPARAGVASFLRPGYAGAIHLFSGHFGSGGSMDVWFQEGVGVVGEHYIHHGTYDEYTKTLRSFLPQRER